MKTEHDSSQWCPVTEKHRKFFQNVRKTSTVRIVEHWPRLHGEVVKSPSFEIFKTQLDTVPGQPALGDLALSRGVD